MAPGSAAVDFRQKFAAMSLRTEAFIDGRFRPAVGENTFASFNPATGQAVAEVAACDSADVDQTVAAARSAFERGIWSRESPRNRARLLHRVAQLIDTHAEELAIIESVDPGKPISDALSGDVPDSAACLRWYAETSDKLYDQLAPTAANVTAMILREPVGVVGAVVPWNFPLLMAVWKVAPALAAGNSVVLKPAELTPLSVLRLAELCVEAGLPDGVLNVVPGLGETAGQAIGRHGGIDCVAFTGSTEVGRLFLKYSAESNLKRVHLECGGKSPCVVLKDAGDLASVAASVASGILWNQGENCTASSRLVVDRSIKDDLLSSVLSEIAKWPVGDPLDPATRIGAMIEPDHLMKVLTYISLGEQEGARVALAGRQTLAETGGNFVTPAVFDDVQNSMRIAQEEIFGPVLSVIPFDTVDDALAIANDTSFGLAACLWTNDLDTAHRVSRALRAGVVSVNCYSEGDMTTPFGGYKLSGFGGRDKSVLGYEPYTETKTIWMQHRLNA